MDTQVLPHDIITNITPQEPTSVPFSDPSVLLPREISAAIEKHDRKQDRVMRSDGFGSTTGGLALSKRFLTPLSNAIRAELELKRDKHDRLVSLIRVVSGLDPDVIALCTLRTVLHCLGMDEKMVATRIAVGHTLAGECWAADLTQHNPRLAARVAKAVVARYPTVSSRQRAAHKMAANAKQGAFTQRDWKRADKLVAGHWLIDVMIWALPNTFRWTTADTPELRTIELTEDAWTIVDAALYQAIEARPVFFPNLVPPVPWTKSEGCGPNDPRLLHSVQFLRSYHAQTQAAVRAAIRDGSMQPMLEAVNVLQAVSWKINPRILAVLHEVRTRGLVVPGVPLAKDLPLPDRLPDAAWKAMSDPEKRLHRMRKAEIHTLNRGAKAERIIFAEDMKLADEMATVDHFYNAMNCDWRGRVYSTVHFNFQREDRVRALFMFADGEPIGEDGLYWLKVHVANCAAFGKIDKQPFDERVKWVDANLEHIRLMAEHPLDTMPYAVNLAWTQADSPFLFLAACVELVAAINFGSTYVARLPVSFDGSCSGLQHLSAMTRAPEGSRVNLTPSDLPQDIYNTVADAVQRRVVLDLDHQPESTADDKQVQASARIRALARMTLDYGVDRNLVKRNVMTYAYSSKKFGMACQLQVDLMGPLARKVLEGRYEEHPFAPYQDGDMERPSAAARYLAGRIFDSIEEIVQKPAEAMKFLQKLARALAHEAKPLRWTTPLGLPWINRYHDVKTKRVQLWLQEGGVSVRIRTTLADGYETAINKDKAANGVAPNFVHALDAAHLLLVANAARSEGISSIATVHDSFGCLPSRAAQFRRIIVEQFLDMYEKHDVLAEVREQASCDLTHNNWHMLPDAIDYGSLNLKDILNADFAFA